MRFVIVLSLALTIVPAWDGCSDEGGSGGSDKGSGSGSGSDSDSDSDADLPAECQISNDFCTLWCCACAACAELDIMEGDCLDDGGQYCQMFCAQTLEDADDECLDAADEYIDELEAVIDDPDDWLLCDSTIDNNHPFDDGTCPEITY